MEYYSDISLNVRVKEGRRDDALRVFEKHGYPPECLETKGNEIRYQEAVIKFLGYYRAEDMLKELRDFVEEGAVDCFGEDHEYTVYEFRKGKLFRVDYEYKPVSEEEII